MKLEASHLPPVTKVHIIFVVRQRLRSVHDRNDERDTRIMIRDQLMVMQCHMIASVVLPPTIDPNLQC